MLASCSKILLNSNNKKDSKNNDLSNISINSSDKSIKKIIYFNTNSFEISEEDANLIKEDIQNILKSNKKIKISSHGHCDERGTKAYNFKLGKNRALAVKKLLIKSGVKASRIAIVSFGENKPVDNGHDESAWAKNRRVEMIIIN
jgi:peptidoglycan-associated lipoprotein